LSVDPTFDPRLLAYDFWAETCYRIRDKHGRLVPLRLNAIQRRLTELEREELRLRGQARLYVLKGRQGGISTDQQARNLHQICTEPGFDTMTLAHIREDTDKLFSITQRAVENYPDELRPPFGSAMSREVGVPEMDAVFWTGTAGAKRTGRGLTLKRVHGSEFAFWDQPRQTLATITPALVPSESVVTLETTASGYDSEGHNFWREAEQGANGYRAVFFPWWECDVENYRLPLLADDELGTLEPDEAELVRLHGLDHEQIKWRRLKMREMGRGSFLQEYAEDSETCWAAAGGMFYDADLLKHLMTRAPVPLYTVETPWGVVEVYEEPVEGERTVGGCDTAEGFTVGEAQKKDRSSFTIRAFPTRRLKVKFESSAIMPEDLAGLLDVWGRKYQTYWAVEKNAHGITTLRNMRDEHHYPLQYIYHRRSQDSANKEPASDLIGWHTNEQTKALLLDYGRTLLTAARDGLADVPTVSALRDAFAVRRDDKGKINLHGRDVLLSEMLCEVGHQSVPPQRSWWLGPLPNKTATTRGR
jgi:hypothetical protein